MNDIRCNGFYYGALLYAFLVPFPQKTINIAIIIWVLFSLISFKKAEVSKNKTLWLLPALYATYFIGIFTAEELSFKFMEYKLSLLAFPLLFFLHRYNQKQRDGILKIFVLGLISSVAVCLTIAFYNSLNGSNGGFIFQPNVLKDKGFTESILYGGNYFFGRHLSVFHQTVYYAMYLSAGVAVLLFKPYLFHSRIIRSIFLGIFIVFVFLISNKASFIVLSLILGLKMWTWKVGGLKKLIGISAFAFILVIFTLYNPRMRTSTVNILKGRLTLEKDARYGFSTRLLSWEAAISLIKERPLLGYSNADAQRTLNKRYSEKGYMFPLQESYNAHSLWLQTWLENGILAIIILASVFLVLLRYCWHDNQVYPLILSVLIILFVNSLFEALFNRFSGISFFAFVVCFIFSNPRGGRAVL